MESVLPVWPTLYPETQAQGWIKYDKEDFRVEEIPAQLPCGEGEHIWLYIEKRGVNTGWVAKKLAEIAGVKEMDVGYAGLKDRQAITRQWFSIYLPRVDTPDFSSLTANTNEDEEIIIHSITRHQKKLRRGELFGNRFEIRLRDIAGDKELINHNLNHIQQGGVPNYFGEQRFGHHGGNIESGRAMLSGEFKVRNRHKKSLYLSAVRSLIFNEVIAERIRQNILTILIDGDIPSEPPAQPCASAAIATAPMWGRGRLATSGKSLELEMRIADHYQNLCNGMEHMGLSQERRPVLVQVENLHWQWSDRIEEMPYDDEPTHRFGEDLTLSFSLASGYYATSVIRELMHTHQRPVSINRDLATKGAVTI